MCLQTIFSCGKHCKQCRLGLFQDSDLEEILKSRNPLLEEHYTFSEVTHLFPISWMCKKQTDVPHSTTESEIISLDTGLRLNGLPVLELRDLIFLSLEA